jgi:hypothetical protein
LRAYRVTTTTTTNVITTATATIAITKRNKNYNCKKTPRYYGTYDLRQAPTREPRNCTHERKVPGFLPVILSQLLKSTLSRLTKFRSASPILTVIQKRKCELW